MSRLAPPARVHAAPPASPSPLWAVQSVTILGSLGTGVVTNGVFFIATHACGFSTAMNYALGLLLGVAYIAGAVGVGPTLGRLAARSSAVSTRAVLVFLSIAMGLVAIVPQAAAWAQGGPDGVGWSIWLVVGVYSPLSGAFWPIVESYLSGGRSGDRLRRAVGQFNVVWAVSVLVALWAMGPLLEHRALSVLLWFGSLQILSVGVIMALRREPGAHLPEHHEPHPPVYVPLLTTFRLLLPTSYYVVSVWSPYAPSVLEKLEVGGAWQTGLAATWMLTRTGVFVLMERWQGWHGRWGTVVVGAGGLVGGIAIALASPSAPGGLAVPGVVLGLAMLGVANGVIYASALYYAMEVGKGEVGAGGTHEALIGVGFAGGPATGLAATGLVGAGVVGAERLDWVILGVLGVCLAVVGVLVFRRVWRAARAVGLVVPHGHGGG